MRPNPPQTHTAGFVSAYTYLKILVNVESSTCALCAVTRPKVNTSTTKIFSNLLGLEL